MPDHAHEAGGHVVVAAGGGGGLLLGPNDENCNMQIKETTGNGTAVSVGADGGDAALHEAEEEAAEKEYKIYPER